MKLIKFREEETRTKSGPADTAKYHVEDTEKE